MGLLKTPDPESSKGVVAEAVDEMTEKTKPRVEIVGVILEGLVSVSEDGVLLLQVGPEAFLTCGALVMASWAGKRIRVTVDVLPEKEKD